MSRFSQLEIYKEQFSFSAAHFTIFSATEREPLHGHNYYVSVKFKINIEHNGLAFDYRDYKAKILILCKQLNLYTLLPSESPYLKIEEKDDLIYAHFNGQAIPFLKQDVIILPITNVTIEELSFWFMQALTTNEAELKAHGIHQLTIRVHNGLLYSASTNWNAKTK